MRVLVTGSSGVLGRACLDRFRSAGLDTVALDQRPPLGSADGIAVADVRRPNDYRDHLSSVDAVVHLAGLHGRDHVSRFPAGEFWSVNVDGTREVYQATEHAGVTHVVLASSMAVYGQIPSAPQREWVVRTERSPATPHDIYALTKLVGEQIAEYHALQTGLRTTVLRFGHFTPASWEHYGFRLLFGGVDVRDAASAVLRALLTPAGETPIRRFNIHSLSPFGLGDISELAIDPYQHVSRLMPGLTTELERRGQNLQSLIWGRSIWPIDCAVQGLGYAPRWNYDVFARDYLAGNQERYEPLTWPRWGLED